LLIKKVKIEAKKHYGIGEVDLRRDISPGRNDSQLVLLLAKGSMSHPLATRNHKIDTRRT
jgi:hypothetical protein